MNYTDIDSTFVRNELFSVLPLNLYRVQSHSFFKFIFPEAGEKAVAVQSENGNFFLMKDQMDDGSWHLECHYQWSGKTEIYADSFREDQELLLDLLMIRLAEDTTLDGYTLREALGGCIGIY